MLPFTHRCALSLPRMARAWALVCLLMGGWMLAWAQAGLVLRADQLAIDPWAQVRVLAEDGAPLGVNEVLKRLAEFRPPQDPKYNLGMRREAVWLHIPVEVPRSDAGRWILDVDYPSLDRIDVYVVTDGRPVKAAQLGDLLLLGQRPLAGRTHALPLVLERGQHHDLLLRVQTSSSMILPLQFIQSEALHERETAAHAGQGLLAGIWLCLMLYSLAQWASVRDVMFGYYALTIASTGLFFISYFGLGSLYLWRDQEWLTRNASPLTVLVAMAGALMFVDRALDIPSMSRRLALAVRVLAGTTALLALLFVLGLISYRSALSASTVLGLSPMLVAVPVAFLRLRQGDRAAGYMLLGWLVYAIGTAHQALLLRGVLPSNFLTQHAFQLGSTVEMALWMLVLGVRLDQIRAAAERAHLERDHMASLAHSDALTGLLNRRGLHASAEPLLGQAGPGRVTAVFLLDLDGFKPVNDTHGHDAGDELLIGVARRLQAQVRANDPVARIGGDEFVVVATGLPGEAEAEKIGQKLLAAFREPFAAAGFQCRVGLTIGYALCPDDGRDLQGLLKRADAAMYAGKQAGKGRVLRGAASEGLTASAAAS